ncbi:MAG: recombinase family protein [Planctomycetaceae bacterium]
MHGIYIRVSTFGQNTAGQKREIQIWLNGNGGSDVKVRWYIDKASGNDLNRPEFERLQKDIFDGKIDTVVVWKLDRLSRNLRDGINTLGDWCERGLRVVSVTQQIDFSGAVGRMLAAVLLGIAEMEQEVRKERQAAGIAAAKERGIYAGRRLGTTKAKPERAKALRAKGLKVREIASALNVGEATVFRYLRKAAG